MRAVQAGKGVILFTHIRRAGGTVLEDYVLKPFAKQSKRPIYLCKEGELGRHYDLSAKDLNGHRNDVRKGE